MTSEAEYQPDAERIFSAFTTAPDAARKRLIDALVVSLKQAGIWAKLDTLIVGFTP